MKMNKIIWMMAMGLLVMGICSCSKEINEDKTTDNELGEPMTLIVNNEGYPTDNSQDHSDVQQSRATEIGFATKFVNGDKVGVFVSKSGGTFENIEFTYNGQSWTPNSTLNYYAEARYTVYYPYSSLITDQATYDQSITNFAPTSDQGTAALYTANDPMSGVGVIGAATQARTLTVKLKHLMGLYVIYPPQPNVAVTFNGGVVPHLIEGTYRYHVRPDSQISITGSYIIDGQNNSFTIPSTTVVANKYNIFRLKHNSGPLPETKSINLNGVDFKFFLVKKGVFQMGSPTDEIGRQTAENQHWVKLTKDYYIAETEVTSAQWYAIQGTNGTKNTTPAEGVSSWENISNSGGYLEKINFAYNVKDGRFALPTEAQWEYAARGGHKAGKKYMQYPGTNTDLASVAHHSNNSVLQPVGVKVVNQLGLFDMAGNMSEICRDWYTTTYTGGSSELNPVVDPFVGNNPGTDKRVLRGGGYSSAPKACRSANRSQHTPDASTNFATGFRLVFEPNI